MVYSRFLTLAFLPLLLPTSAVAFPLSPSSAYTVKTVYQEAKNDTWFENCAVRSNGQIVFTSLGHPGGIHMIDPLARDPTPVLLHQFPNLNTTAGITEASPDEFYFVASSIDLETLQSRPGSNNIFRLTFSSDGKPQVNHLVRVTDAKLLNGVVAISPALLLAADSDAGLIWAIPTASGSKPYIASHDPSFVPPSSFPFTVNGLHFRGQERSTLYFTNTALDAFGRMPIHANGTQAGPIKTLAHSTGAKGAYDDFIFGPDGNAYAAVGSGNSIQKITIDSQANVIHKSVIAGNLNSTLIAEPTSAAFGRTEADKDVLYVFTGGASLIPVVINGTEVSVGAQILAISKK